MSSKITSNSKNQLDEKVSSAVVADQSIQNINRHPAKPVAPVVEKSASAFRTISEVADELGVQQHVLRFWESKFSYIQPLKRGGGRRYYNPKDIDLLKGIQHLLYNEGYTIKGVQKLLQKTRGNLASVINAGTAAKVKAEIETAVMAEAIDNNKDELKAMLADLKSMRTLID